MALSLVYSGLCDEWLLACYTPCFLQDPHESAETLTRQVYKKAQAALVYDFIVQHADLDYYVDDTPAQVTVETDGESQQRQPLSPSPTHDSKATSGSSLCVSVCVSGVGGTQHGVKAFPKGADIEQWHKMREQTEHGRNSLREKAQRLFVDPKVLRKFGKTEDL